MERNVIGTEMTRQVKETARYVRERVRICQGKERYGDALQRKGAITGPHRDRARKKVNDQGRRKNKGHRSKRGCVPCGESSFITE